jgi:T5SS/PEP-CTERM-associated repeat protein
MSRSLLFPIPVVCKPQLQPFGFIQAFIPFLTLRGGAAGALVSLIALGGSLVPAHGQVIWLGGTGNWFGPWVGNTLNGTITSSTTNWTPDLFPRPSDSVTIGNLFGPPIGPVSGTAILTSATTVGGVSLGNGAFGGVNVTGAGNLTLGGLNVGFSAGGNLNISSGGVVNTGSLSLGILAGGNGNATVSGAGSQLKASGPVLVGDSGNGSLTLNSGARGGTASQLIIGSAVGSTGTMTVTDPGTAWTSGYVYVGQSGTGTLTVQNGAAFTGFVNIQEGTATVTGPGSSLTGVYTVGEYGNGTLTIQNGASVSSGGLLFIGHYGTGALTLTGAGSSLTTGGELVVGLGHVLNGIGFGSGTVTIQNGAHANSGSGTIAPGLDDSSGTVLVTGAGSQWNNSGDLGIYAKGSLTIQNSGVVNAVRTYAGGMTTVTGTGAQLNTRLLQVGTNVPGTLTIQNGGVLNSSFDGYIGGWYGGAGSVLVTGAGTQWNPSSVYIGNGATGSLTIQNGGVVNSGAVAVSGTQSSLLIDGSGSQLIATDLSLGGGNFTIQNGGVVSSRGNARIGGNVIVDDATWTNIGTLDIGINKPGCVTVQNSGVLNAAGATVGSLGCLIFHRFVGQMDYFTLDSGGLLTLDIAGFGPGLFSQLDILGFGLFAGTIDIDFINGFVPQAGESFDLINALGGFDFSKASVQIEGVPAGFQLEETFQDGELQITASSPEPGSLYLFATVLIAFFTIGMWRKRMSRRTA